VEKLSQRPSTESPLMKGDQFWAEKSVLKRKGICGIY